MIQWKFLKIGFHLIFFDKSNDWVDYTDLDLKEYNSYISKIINLSSFNILNINDLVEKVKPSVYYMISYLKNCFSDDDKRENLKKTLLLDLVLL